MSMAMVREIQALERKIDDAVGAIDLIRETIAKVQREWEEFRVAAEMAKPPGESELKNLPPRPKIVEEYEYVTSDAPDPQKGKARA